MKFHLVAFSWKAVLPWGMNDSMSAVTITKSTLCVPLKTLQSARPASVEHFWCDLSGVSSGRSPLWLWPPARKTMSAEKLRCKGCGDYPEISVPPEILTRQTNSPTLKSERTSQIHSVCEIMVSSHSIFSLWLAMLHSVWSLWAALCKISIGCSVTSFLLCHLCKWFIVFCGV